MTRKLPLFLLLGSAMSLTACGGGGGGGGAGGLAAFAERYADLGSDPTLASMTSNATVDAQDGSASYIGVINVGTDDPTNPAGAASYYGNLNMTVNFDNGATNDAITGSAGGFVQYFSEVASSKTGSSVSGSMTITGNLTGNNESFTDGIAASASGTIDGITVAYDVDGNINGVGADGMSLYFDGTNAVSSGGVGLAVR